MRGEDRRSMQVVVVTALCFAATVAVALTASASSSAASLQGTAIAVPGAAATSALSGVYTEEQAKRGEAVSDKLCTTCHGPELTGAEGGPGLVGEEFLAAWTDQTVADFYDRVHTTMPADTPGSMTPQQTVDVTAYILKLNKFPAGQSELSTDVAQLKGIRIEGPPTQ